MLKVDRDSNRGSQLSAGALPCHKNSALNKKQISFPHIHCYPRPHLTVSELFLSIDFVCCFKLMVLILSLVGSFLFKCICFQRKCLSLS